MYRGGELQRNSQPESRTAYFSVQDVAALLLASVALLLLASFGLYSERIEACFIGKLLEQLHSERLAPFHLLIDLFEDQDA